MDEKKRLKSTKTDYTIKHITIKDGEKTYLVGFRCNLLQGVRVIYMSGFSPEAKVISTFPPLSGVIGNMLMELGTELQNFGIHISERFNYRGD